MTAPAPAPAPASDPASNKETTEPQVARLTKADRIGRWLTLGANIGVVLGLILLIAEMRQNSKLTALTLEKDRSNAQSAYESHLTDPFIADAWMTAVYAPETLSNTQLKAMDSLLATQTSNYDLLLSMKEAGLVTRARVEQNVSNSAPYAFGSAFGKRWWAVNEAGYQGTEMYEIAGPIIQAIDEDFLKQYYESLRFTGNGSVSTVSADPSDTEPDTDEETP